MGDASHRSRTEEAREGKGKTGSARSGASNGGRIPRRPPFPGSKARPDGMAGTRSWREGLARVGSMG